VDRSTFETRLWMASQQAVQFARQYVCEVLPDDVVFLVYPNQSCDDNPRVGDEAVFPDESLPEGRYHGPWQVDEVLSFLWRDGKVPEWIDISVKGVSTHHTVVRLRCCGRFTGQGDLLYHRNGGVPPFSVKSPYLPPGWESVEASGRFSLDWRQQ
jgi:hypothetical protein